MKIVYLKPRSSYRTELHSDTLFGLLCWGIRQVFSATDLENLLNGFRSGKPPFLISSAFPYRETDGGRLYFLPRPILKPAHVKIDDPSKAQRQKEFKGQRWVDVRAFQKFLDGIMDEKEYYESGEWDQKGAPGFKKADVLHNTIDRLSGTTGGTGGNLFQLPETFVEEGGGLYFLVRGENAAMLEGALGFLSHMGMGGDSALGKGRFEVEVGDATLFSEPEDATHFVTLSLYHPRKTEVEAYREGDAWYDLTMRKGKVGGHFLHAPDFWKRTVPMFVEGSTFPRTPEVRFYGDNPVVKRVADGLPFDVQHYGYAFDVGMKVKGG